jgi:diguanylate cyclase (GGDEF)-like protein/putative nucleotidyltransferase with HDIG domain
MTRNAKLFVTVLLTLAMGVLAASFAEWHPADVAKFSALYLLAVLASVLRVVVPKMVGDISFSLIFVLIGIVELPLAEALLLGCTTLVIESVWKAGTRPNPSQVFFAIGNLTIAIASSQYIYNSYLLRTQVAESVFRILIAASTCFAANTFAVAAAISLTERISLLKVWQEKSFSSYPHYLLAGAVAWAFKIVSEAANSWAAGLLVLPTLYLLLRTYALYVGRLEDGKMHAEELASLHMRTIEALAGAIEAKDDNTHDHLKRVQVYAVEIAREFGMNETELEALRAAAVLHDIGKLAVPEHIISKPGRLTPEEFEKMKVHPVVGAEILERVQFPYPVAPIVMSHHEKWDGSGYPHGLRGEEIPLGSRILSAVDALDALASDRQYRKALPLSEAMAKIALDAGQAFDPKVIAVLKRRYVELERKAKAQSRMVIKLSTDIKVTNGAAPAAGFASGKKNDAPGKRPSGAGFLEAVAMVRRDVLYAFESSQPDGGTFGVTESLSVFAIRLKRLIDYDAAVVYLVRDGVLQPEFVHGHDFRLFSSLRIPMGQGLSGWVAENRMPILNGNPSVEAGYMNDPNTYSTLRSALGIPLETAESIIGVLSLYRDERDAFTNEDLGVLEAAAPRLALAIETTLAERRDGDSDLDTATNLPGARALMEHLAAEVARARRLNSPVTIFVCRVDGLRGIRDSFGQIETNRALRSIAVSIKEICREFDYLARSGGNEFVLVAPGVTDAAAETRTRRLSQISVTHGNHTATVSVGAAYFPNDGDGVDQLLAKADRALFSPRGSGDEPFDLRVAAYR